MVRGNIPLDKEIEKQNQDLGWKVWDGLMVENIQIHRNTHHREGAYSYPTGVFDHPSQTGLQTKWFPFLIGDDKAIDSCTYQIQDISGQCNGYL